MSTATWGDPDSFTDDKYPLSLLKHLLQQMMRQFVANGACIALHDESIDQMVVRLHIRFRGALPTPMPIPPRSGETAQATDPYGRRITIDLSRPSTPAPERAKITQQLTGELDLVTPQHSELFPVGTPYPINQDLIGYTWRKNESLIMRHEDYLSSFHPRRMTPMRTDAIPTRYLAVPIVEPQLVDEVREKKRPARTLGVVILYQTTAGLGFQQKQCSEALASAERIALYLLNDQLQRQQRRTGGHMQRLQEIASAFPSTVKLSDLVEYVYKFVTEIVDVSSLLLTLYDRDMQKIYDIFAVKHGERVDSLLTHPLVAIQEERPAWWRVIQEEKRTLLLAPNNPVASNDPEQEPIGAYEELLQGPWGDQHKAESFLLLPMKMFTRVIGSLSLTSTHANAYRPADIQVLETMVQIITVSIENAKLYDRSRQSLREAKQREEALAAMNSALQAISAVLNINELLNKFVETVAKLVQAQMCTFLQLSPDGNELIAQAIYDASGKWRNTIHHVINRPDKPHDELIEMIHVPYKGTMLERLNAVESFFYLDAEEIEQLAEVSDEGGAIFLRETLIEKMLMVPVHYQQQIVGILAVHTPRQKRVFRPKEIGMLLAICAQAASAIRNAQLFEEIQEANAELQRMDKLKDEFIVTASHELRTPLSAISGYASLLKRQNARITPQQVLRFATKIAASTQQLSDLVANMTDAAKIGALDKKLDLHMAPVQLRAAVDVAVSMLSVNIEQKILTNVPSDLWMECDALRLRQVVNNLLDNAAKYSPPTTRILVAGNATLHSKLSLPEDQIDHTLVADGNDPEVVLLRVCDEGEGIPSEDQLKIFEKFVRAPRSLTTPVRGSGLGLFICRRYIEAMGGRLWLEESIPGEGSIFSFYLPRIAAPIEMSEQDEQEEAEVHTT